MSDPSERGNVLFLILLAIVLLAALNYAAMEGLRGGGKDAASEKLGTQVAEIMNQTALMDGAIARLRARCDETQISFENGIVSGYTNSKAPPDKSCHVFDLAGAGLNWLTSSASGATDRSYIFSGYWPIINVGATRAWNQAELLMVLPDISRNLCVEINRRYGVPITPIPLENGAALIPNLLKFTGMYRASGNPDIDGDGTPGGSKIWYGPETGCSQLPDPGGDYFIYYHALIPR